MGRHNITDESYRRRRAARLGMFSFRRRELNGRLRRRNGIPERRILPIAEMEHVLGDVDSNGSKSASESVHVPPRASNERGSADSRQTAQSTFIFDFFFFLFFFFLLLFFLSFFPPCLLPFLFAIGNFL